MCPPHLVAPESQVRGLTALKEKEHCLLYTSLGLQGHGQGTALFMVALNICEKGRGQKNILMKGMGDVHLPLMDKKTGAQGSL